MIIYCSSLILIMEIQFLTATADAKSYILISKLPPKAYKECVEDKSKSHATGFTFVVMSIIYLAGGNITQGTRSIHAGHSFSTSFSVCLFCSD